MQNIPRVSAIVHILRITSSGDGLALRDACIDSVDVAEGVNIGFQVP